MIEGNGSTLIDCVYLYPTDDFVYCGEFQDTVSGKNRFHESFIYGLSDNKLDILASLIVGENNIPLFKGVILMELLAIGKIQRKLKSIDSFYRDRQLFEKYTEFMNNRIRNKDSKG
ncbi:MAG: hypothetical protein GTN76_16215 [Candidatus Aenigmarchaeota archaeon]|nr:hypothetical protein [Candidatus Aenigmarchaeota archaeon]